MYVSLAVERATGNNKYEKMTVLDGIKNPSRFRLLTFLSVFELDFLSLLHATANIMRTETLTRTTTFFPFDSACTVYLQAQSFVDLINQPGGRET